MTYAEKKKKLRIEADIEKLSRDLENDVALWKLNHEIQHGRYLEQYEAYDALGGAGKSTAHGIKFTRKTHVSQRALKGTI